MDETIQSILKAAKEDVTGLGVEDGNFTLELNHPFRLELAIDAENIADSKRATIDASYSFDAEGEVSWEGGDERSLPCRFRVNRSNEWRKNAKEGFIGEGYYENGAFTFLLHLPSDVTRALLERPLIALQREFRKTDWASATDAKRWMLVRLIAVQFRYTEEKEFLYFRIARLYTS